MDKKEKISVIIPCYNEKEKLSVKIPHLISISENNSIEIIVVDSSQSDDESENLCEDFLSVNYIKSSNAGRAYQMNEGAKIASGEILLFVHADVKLPDNFTSLIQKTLKKNNAGFFNYEFDKKGFWLKFNASFVKEKGTFTGGGDQCHFFKKETFESLGGYNEKYCIMEDFELIDRVKKAKIPYSIIKTPVTVSARKYEKNSWLKISLINGYVFLLYRLGASPKRLERGYKRLLRK